MYASYFWRRVSIAFSKILIAGILKKYEAISHGVECVFLFLWFALFLSKDFSIISTFISRYEEKYVSSLSRMCRFMHCPQEHIFRYYHPKIWRYRFNDDYSAGKYKLKQRQTSMLKRHSISLKRINVIIWRCLNVEIWRGFNVEIWRWNMTLFQRWNMTLFQR